MNQKIAIMVFVFLLLLGLSVLLPDSQNSGGKLLADKGIGAQDSEVVFKDCSNQPAIIDATKLDESNISEPAEKNHTDAVITNPNGKSQLENENQHSSPNKTDSPPLAANKNYAAESNNNSNISGSSNSKTTNVADNSNSQQILHGGPTVDKNKYPLLSKVNGSFGQFRYRDLEGGRIEVDPLWVAENIVTITLPGLNRQVQVHKDAADHFISAFNFIKDGTTVVNGQVVPLLSLIYSMDGTYVPRHVNWNSAKGLSNHSWGTAIDINASGHFGYVDPQKDLHDPNLILWEKAFKPAGFSWGNRYNDSMHYELIK